MNNYGNYRLLSKYKTASHVFMVTSVSKSLRETMANCLGLITCFVVGLVMKTSAAPADAPQPVTIGNAKFTSAFYDLMRNQEGNLLISPASLEILLAMTHRGAGGKTATQIQQAAHLLNDQYPWVDALKSDANVTLDIANAIFPARGFTIKQDYLDFVKNRMKGEVTEVDFTNNKEATKTINEFVAKKTGKKIEKLFNEGELDTESVLVLLNAVYFKADWAKAFPKSITEKGIFHLNEQQSEKVDYMKVQSHFNTNINQHLDARILEIPYKGNSVSMILAIPNTSNGLPSLESKIANYDLNQLTENMYPSNIILTMPKFKLENTIDLKDLLIKMGVEDLFNPLQANLTGLAAVRLHASGAIQKTYIKVNEEGSEAAAASAIFFVPYSAPRPVTDVLVDRPFLFLLKHKTTGRCLFMGRFVSP